MSRPILSYSDISSVPTPSHHLQRPYKPRGKFRGQGRGRDPNVDDAAERRKKRKYDESSEQGGRDWDGESQRQWSAPNYGNKTNLATKARESIPVLDSSAWDDSTLIEAWDAAMEEYHVLNGPDKDWKAEPVHKDSIWYKASQPSPWEEVKRPARETNIEVAKHPANVLDEDNEEIDFTEAPLVKEEDTQGDEEAYRVAFDSLPDTRKMSKADIFQKAVEASYWAGYWASAYQAC